MVHLSKSQHYLHLVETRALPSRSAGGRDALRGWDWITACFCRMGSSITGRSHTHEVEP